MTEVCPIARIGFDRTVTAPYTSVGALREGGAMFGALKAIFGKKPPAWAAPLTAQQFPVFQDALLSALSQVQGDDALATAITALDARALKAAVASGAIPCANGKLQFSTIARTAALCASPADISDVVHRFVANAIADDEAVQRFATDIHAARDALRVQLVPRTFIRDDGQDGLNYKPFAGDVVCALVYDLPTAVTTVPASHVAGWNTTIDALLPGALQAVQAHLKTLGTGDAPGAVLHTEEGRVESWSADESFFIATQALWVETMLGNPVGGVLCGIPSRHVLMAYPVDDATAWQALSALATPVVDMFRELPGHITPDLFWIKDGQVTTIPVRTRTDDPHATTMGLQVLPPAELMTAWEALFGPPT